MKKLGHGAAASAMALASLYPRGEHPHDRKVEGSVVRGQCLEEVGPLRGLDPHAPDRDIHGCEVLPMALVDSAIETLLLTKAPVCPWAQRDPHVGRNDGGGAPLLAAPSPTQPRARAAWPGSIQFRSTPSATAPPRRHSRGRIAATTMRVASGRSARSSVTARLSASICKGSAPDPIPSHSLAGSIPRWSSSAAIWAG